MSLAVRESWKAWNIAHVGRYVSEGNDRKIRENESQIDDLKREMSTAVDARDTIEKALQAIQEEIAKQENLRSNITQNMRYRKGEKEIIKVQEEIDSIDIESAAKARKEFVTKYDANLELENAKKSAVSFSFLLCFFFGLRKGG